jgi:tetratricopeptide (TPR) repeat protein
MQRKRGQEMTDYTEYKESLARRKTADALMKGEKYQDAMNIYRELVMRYPTFKCYEQGAVCLYHLHEYPEAILWLYSVIGWANNQFRAYYYLAMTYFELGDVEMSMQKLDECLKINPKFKLALEFKERHSKDYEIYLGEMGGENIEPSPDIGASIDKSDPLKMAEESSSHPQPGPMDSARFRLLTFSLYPAVRTQQKAERIMAKVQSLLSSPIKILPCAPHESPTPLFRVNGELPISVVGAYAALTYALEYLRPLSAIWLVTLPEHDLSNTSWHIWGNASHTNVVGLAEVYFSADSESETERSDRHPQK